MNRYSTFVINDVDFEIESEKKLIYLRLRIHTLKPGWSEFGEF